MFLLLVTTPADSNAGPRLPGTIQHIGQIQHWNTRLIQESVNDVTKAADRTCLGNSRDIQGTEQMMSGCKPSSLWDRNPAETIFITHTRFLANISHTIIYDYTKTCDVMEILTADCRVRYVVRSIQPCLNESSAHSQHASRDVLKTESAPFWKAPLTIVASGHCNCRH